MSTLMPSTDHVMLCVPFLLSAGATGLSIPLARAAGIVDRPGALKAHERITPRFGGLGIVAAVAIPAAALRLMAPLAIAGLLMIAMVGAIDDRFCLRPRHKLLGEAVAGLLLGLAFAHGPLGIAALPLAVALVVALANGVNLIDGLNGLAAGYAVIAAAGFVLLLLPGGVSLGVAACLCLGALGFLPWNFPKARTFMGDMGSLGIGYCLAYLLVSLAQVSAASFVAALPLVAIPLCDMALGIVRRWLRGRPLFEGDRDHFYDVLNRRLQDATTTALVVYGLALLFLGLGLLAARMRIAVALSVYAAIIVGLIPLSLRVGFLPRRRGYRAEALPEIGPRVAMEEQFTAGAVAKGKQLPSNV